MKEREKERGKEGRDGGRKKNGGNEGRRGLY